MLYREILVALVYPAGHVWIYYLLYQISEILPSVASWLAVTILGH